MTCRGEMFAISDLEGLRLFDAKDDQVREVVEDIDDKWDEQWLCQLDKSWDAIHRCLSDGTLYLSRGRYPLNHAVLGGRGLHKGDDYIVCYVAPNQVADVARAYQM